MSCWLIAVRWVCPCIGELKDRCAATCAASAKCGERIAAGRWWRRTFGPLSMNFTANSSPLPLDRINFVTPKLPLPRSLTCRPVRALPRCNLPLWLSERGLR
jgi:hypothetical protein